MKRSRYQSGFTLIEMMVVVAIIGLLASMTVLTFSRQQMNSRNARRMSDLKNIQTAVENFNTDTGAYPVVTGYSSDVNNASWRSNRPYGGINSEMGRYITGLTPNYITKLPVDPQYDPAVDTYRGYIYWSSSTGSDYAFIAHGSPEGSWTTTHPFFDPARADMNAVNRSWKVYSPGGINH